MKKFIKDRKFDLVFASFYFVIGFMELVIGNYEKAFLWSFIGLLMMMLDYSLWSHKQSLILLLDYTSDVKKFYGSADAVMESFDQMVLAVDPKNANQVLEMQNTIKKSRIMREEIRKETEKYVHEQRANSTSMSRG